METKDRERHLIFILGDLKTTLNYPLEQHFANRVYKEVLIFNLEMNEICFILQSRPYLPRAARSHLGYCAALDHTR